MHMGSAGECQPLSCETAMACIDGARNPSTTPLELGRLRGRIEDCSPCVRAFDMEVKLRTTMVGVSSELPTFEFRARITHTLASVDLSQIEVGDIEF